MTSYVTPKKNTAYVFYVSLEDQANAGLFKASPTLAAGDVLVSTDDGAPGNIATLPTVDADFTKRLKVSLSAAEMNGDNVTVIFSDAAGAEWFDLEINLQTTARQIDDLAFPTVSGRGLDVSAGGEAGVDWANVGSPTTTLALTGTSLNSVSGSVGSVAGNVDGKVLGGGAGVLAGVGVQADMQQMDGSATPVDNLVLSIGSDGHIKANLVQILGTTLTETVAGYLAAAFKKFFNVATPTGTANSLPDAVAGAAGGVAIVGSEMGLANDAITAGKFDELTAFPLKSADSGSTKVARVGADSDTLETLSDQLDAIQAITDAIDTSAVTVTTSNNAGKLTIERTATFAATVSGLAIPADWLAVIWTVKGAASDDDDDAVLQVRVSNPAVVLTDGLQRIEGVAPSGSLTIASGSCTVNQAGGTVVLALKAAATAALTVRGGAAWDLRVLRPPTGEADELTTGTADIVYTVTHART